MKTIRLSRVFRILEFAGLIIALVLILVAPLILLLYGDIITQESLKDFKSPKAIKVKNIIDAQSNIELEEIKNDVLTSQKSEQVKQSNESMENKETPEKQSQEKMSHIQTFIDRFPSPQSLINRAAKRAFQIEKDIVKNLKNNTVGLKAGTNSLKVMVVSHWRSGSSFTSLLLASHPASFLIFEPLHHYGIERVMTTVEKSDLTQLEVLLQMIKCDFTADARSVIGKSSNNFQLWVKAIRIALVKQRKTKSLFFPECRGKGIRSSFRKCINPSYLNEICKQIPVQVLKLDRLSLHGAKFLLEHLPNEDFRIVYEVRDPRATMSSRLETDWCPKKPFCISSKILCYQIQQDFKSALELQAKHPKKFMAVRMEDLLTQGEKMARIIMEFMGLNMEQATIDFIRRGGQNHRDPIPILNKWKTHLTWDDITNIQNNCMSPMQNWGYIPVQSLQDMKNVSNTFTIFPMPKLRSK